MRAKQIVIRRATAVDVEAAVALAAAVPLSAQWPRDAYNSYVLRQPPDESAQLRVLFVASVVDDPAETSLSDRPEIIAFAAFSAIAQASAGACEMENMAVADPWRRRGVGSRVVAAGELWCRSHNVATLWLEVRASNSAALALYEGAGFTATGRRRGYYTHPDEDAIQMRKKLSSHVSAC